MPYPDPTQVGKLYLDRNGLTWYYNGTTWVPSVLEGPVVAVAQQSVGAATLAQVAGTKVTLPIGLPKAGTTILWEIAGRPTTGAAVADTWTLRFGAAGTTSDQVIATQAFTGTAGGVTESVLRIKWTIRVATSGAMTSSIFFNCEQDAATGFSNAVQNVKRPACTNATATLPGTVPLYASICLLTGAGQVIAIEQADGAVIKAAN